MLVTVSASHAVVPAMSIHRLRIKDALSVLLSLMLLTATAARRREDVSDGTI